MTEQPYTPTTEQVRRAYVQGMRNAFVDSASAHEAEFDRWLNTVNPAEGTAPDGAIAVLLNYAEYEAERKMRKHATARSGHAQSDIAAAARRELANLLEARAEVERLHTWQGMLSLLDEHWPEDVFPTLTDNPARDTGPRLVSALRRLKEDR